MKKFLHLVAAMAIAITTPVFAQDDAITIGLSVDQLFESRVGVNDAIKAEAERRGYKVIEVVADGNAQTQNAQIQSLITQQVDVIIVCAVDQNTIEQALVGADRASIPVVAYDRALPDSRVVAAFVGPDSIADGLAAGQYMVDQLKGETGDIVVLELLGALNDQNGIDRSKGFNDAFAALPNAKIIAMPTDWDSARALAAVQSAFQANPDIRGIFAATDTQIPSIETVLTDMNKLAVAGEPGHVIVTGVNGSNDGYQATVKGTADGIVVMDLAATGTKAVELAAALVAGESVEKVNVIPGAFYSTADIEANKATIWGAK